MKKTTFILTCLIGLSGLMQAQELKSSSQIDDLLNRRNQIQKYDGNISDHFTREEQRILRNYLTTQHNLRTTSNLTNNRPLTAAEVAEIDEAALYKSQNSTIYYSSTPQNRIMADIIPTAGATESFSPSVGDHFFDPGGPGGANTDGEPGNYPNCGCDTQSTLAGVSEIEFLEFGVNGYFDYLKLYDGTDTSGTLLYDNSLEGANNGDKTLADMIASTGSASFTATSGNFFFFFHSSTVVNWMGWDVEIMEASGGGGGNTYCIPEGTNSDRFINNFSTTGGSENISNMDSGFSPDGYGDFYDTYTVAQETGETVDFSVDIEGGTAGFRVWVDWNQDGEFDITEEVAYSSTSYENTQSGSFTVPAAAMEGDTRMRIVSHWLSSSGDIDPCETGFTYGEFEDYKFTVEGGGGGGTFPDPYCGPLDFTTNVEPITSVQVAGINNVSDPTVDGSPAHEDFTAVSGDMETGMSYDYALEGNTAGGFTNRFVIFIDWNQNGVLNDAGEVYEVIETINGSTGTDGQQATGTILVPSDAMEGNTRMRVKKQFGTTNYLDPCLGAGYGQAEDYTINVTGGSTGGGDNAYAINNSAEMFGTFNTVDPSVFNAIGASGVNTDNFENAGSMNPNDPTIIYVLDNANNLYSVDAATGAYTSLGSIAAPGGEGWVGLEFDTTTGDLYGLSGTISVSSTVSLIDLGAMTATPLGSQGAVGISGAIAMAIDGSGTIYVHDITEDAIYTVDRTTGVGSFLGATGFDANYGQGMGYDQLTDTIYLTAFNNTLFDSELRTLDTATGATTVVGQMQPGDLTQYGWVSFESSVVVGVGENALDGFTYYPNPTSDVLSLKSINNIESITIHNLLGQQVMSRPVGATSTDLNLSGLATGTYVMKVSIDGQIGTYKVLKK